MDWLWLILPAWLVFSLATYVAMVKDHKRTFRSMTRGDTGFFVFIASLGPLAICILIAATCGGWFSKFWDKEVWRR